MKLDKFAIFGIALAAALLILQMQFSAKNQADIAAREAAEVTTTTSGEPLLTPAEQEIAAVNSALPDDFTAEEVTLSNDQATFKFSTSNGGISRVQFQDQHEVNQEDVLVELNRFGAKGIGGIESPSGEALDAGYKIVKQTADSITFLGKLSNGAIVQKEWSFAPSEVTGSPYRLDYKLTIENPNQNSLEASSLNLYVGGATPLYKKELPDQSGFYYLGADGYKKKKSNPLKKSLFGSKLKSLEDTVEELEFAGVGNQFFTCYLTPAESYTATYIARTKEVSIAESAGGGLKNEISLAVSLPREVIEGSNGREQFNFEIYTGPKHYQTLKKIEPNGGLVMNYGFFRPISGVLNNILSFLYNKVFSNFAGAMAWGLSIIALTVVIRTLLWPLHNVSARSMKRMSKLQPKIAELKEKYPDEPQKVQQEQMKLFGEYGINPMGGCLPMLGQIPIFFGLFTMLKSAVEFRHEGFLWIDDLSQPDTLFQIPLPMFDNGLPVNILPIMMFITMAIQMRMNPAPTDPTQKMIMRLMPLMMVVFCYNFASALALYWTTSNIFTIFQTWLVKKLPEPELKKKKGAKPGGFMEKLQKQAEQMQKMQEEQKKSRSTGGNPGGQMRDAKPKKRGPKTGG